MSGISLSRAFEEANALTRREAGLLTPVALALIVLPAIVIDLLHGGVPVSPAAAAAQGFQPAMLANPVGLLLTLLASLVISLLALRPAISVREAFGIGARRLGIAAGTSILLGVGLALVAVPAIPLMMGGQAAVQRLNPAVSLLLLLYMAAALAVLVFVLVRLLLLNTVIAVEREGLLASIRRAWRLTHGMFWRLLGLAAAFLAASLIATLAVVTAGGVVFLTLGRVLGDPDLGRLLASIVASVVNAAFLTWLYVMLACVYRQVAGAAGSSRGI